MKYLVLLALAGCANASAEPIPSHPRTIIIGGLPNSIYVARFTDTLPDGGVVYCYTYKDGFGGGISCLRQVR